MKPTSSPWRFSLQEMLWMATWGGIAFCGMRLLVAYPAFLGFVVPVLFALGLIAGFDRINRMTASSTRIFLGVVAMPAFLTVAYMFSMLVIYLHHR